MTTSPTGTITFLFTDIESSTRMWENYRQEMGQDLRQHDNLMREEIERNGGHVFKTVGDAFCAAFSTASEAVQAALDGQLTLQKEQWQVPGGTKVRMALHSGEAEERDGDYFGPTVNRVARLLSAGHGGQILTSLAATELVKDALPQETSLRSLGTHQLKDLSGSQQLNQLCHPDLPTEFPALSTLDSIPNNLQPQPTPLIGRDRELADIKTIIGRDEVRLMTLSGPGGVGKTRLAIQAAADLAESFAFGAFFVKLAPVSDPQSVIPTIARTLGVQATDPSGIEERLKTYLGTREMLLVIDNFEQVTAATPIIVELSQACPSVKFLVTSRHVLNVRGERQYAVEPLSTPPSMVVGSTDDTAHTVTQYEAVRLFIERARDARPDFTVDDDNAPALAEICYQLDGLPLAIEIAAAKVRVLTPEALLERLSDQLKILRAGPRDLPARQQTIRDTIEWSYELLEEEERRLFNQMAAFVDGCTLEAVEAVCHVEHLDILDGVTSLVEKSLIRQQDSGGEPRFMMLEMIREYGLERLRDGNECRQTFERHLQFFVSFGIRMEPKLEGGEQVEAFRQLRAEHNNIRAAVERALGTEVDRPEKVLELVSALRWYCVIQGHMAEGFHWLEPALQAVPEAPIQLRAKALNTIGALAAQILNDKAQDYLREGRALLETTQDAIELGWSCMALGLERYFSRDFLAAQSVFKEGVDWFEKAGDKWGVGHMTRLMGLVSLGMGRIQDAAKYIEQGLQIARTISDKTGISIALRNLGLVRLSQGDYEAVERLGEESLATAAEMQDSWGTILGLEGLAQGSTKRGTYERAATLFGIASSLRDAVETPIPPVYQQAYDECVAIIEQELGTETYREATARGRRMPLRQAVEYALMNEDQKS
jgi:predicted ATPase/class 3 adenylate cyclase